MVKEKIVNCRECGKEFNIYTRPPYKRVECSDECRENWLKRQGKPMEYKEDVNKGRVEYKPIPVDYNRSAASTACKVIGGICLIIAIFPLWGMFSDFIEFGAFVNELRQMYPPEVFNDPMVQAAIADGYARLAQGPLALAIPMIVIAIILFVASKFVSRASTPSRVNEVVPTPL